MPDHILPPGQVIAQLTEGIEKAIRETQQDQPDPGKSPANHLLVTDCPFPGPTVGLYFTFLCQPRSNRTISLIFLRNIWKTTLYWDTLNYKVACPTYAHSKASHQAPAGLHHPPLFPFQKVELVVPSIKDKICCCQKIWKDAHFTLEPPFNRRPTNTTPTLSVNLVTD